MHFETVIGSLHSIQTINRSPPIRMKELENQSHCAQRSSAKADMKYQ